MLFETWEETSDVAKACSTARVSERTFYNWKPRFETGGYKALEEFASHAPKEPNRTSDKIEQEVIEMRRQNESWGRQRIADELAKLPAVSGSSGRLVVERVKTETVEADYPGAVFANKQLDYAQAMYAFVPKTTFRPTGNGLGS